MRHGFEKGGTVAVSPPERIHMPEITEAGTIFLREGTPLPETLQFESEPYLAGWRLVKGVGALGLGRKLREAGWNFFSLAGDSNATTFGFGEEKTVRRAIKRILANRSFKNFNVLEIARVSSSASKRFLGVSYVTLSAHSRHIQKSVFLFQDNDTQKWERDTLAPAA
jgi:hypothetical protein